MSMLRVLLVEQRTASQCPQTECLPFCFRHSLNDRDIIFQADTSTSRQNWPEVSLEHFRKRYTFRFFSIETFVAIPRFKDTKIIAYKVMCEFCTTQNYSTKQAVKYLCSSSLSLSSLSKDCWHEEHDLCVKPLAFRVLNECNTPQCLFHQWSNVQANSTRTAIVWRKKKKKKKQICTLSSFFPCKLQSKNELSD